MATKYKGAKTELIAIYRLEFYKDKKNWKFCQDVCKKDELDAKSEKLEPEVEPQPELKPSNDTETVLNKTYNIIIEPKAEGGTDLNDAFLETGPEKVLPVTPQDVKADISWPHCCKNLFQEEQKRPEDVWSEPDRPWPEWVPDGAWGLLGHTDQIWQNIPPQEYITMPVLYPGQAYYANYGGWQYNDGWTQNAGDANGLEGDLCDGALYPDIILEEADRWLQADQTEATGTANLEDAYSASLESFMLGAAAAPHSSELDLRSRSVSSEPVQEAGRLSPRRRQLAVDVARHANALRSLLHEARSRDQLASSRSIDHPWEEPTRDPGPSIPNPTSRPYHYNSLDRQETFVKDSFVAGSFKTVDELPGKGRGRLRTRPGVIGIGMGRPYRL